MLGASSPSTVANALDDALDLATEAKDDLSERFHDTTSSIDSWINDELEALDERPPHRRPGRRPHHPHHGKPNQTVYELIAGSKYTTKLAKWINEYDDLVEALNSTKGNYTVFAPTDKAFEKIPDHGKKPSKEQLKAYLTYHVVPEFYPAGRVLASHTAPTLLKSDSLGSEPLPQRIAFRIGLRGLTVNVLSRIVAINIFGTNGVIHGIDAPIFPALPAITLIDLFPGQYSTLELGLVKTGLLDKLNTTDHAGGTFFAPSNWAFQKLGPKINAFLFSKYGEKYLKALLEYHVVPDNTLYSDAYYHANSSSAEPQENAKGIYHVDLPTLLKDRYLAIDIARWGGLIEIKINAFARVAFQDVIAKDGVIHSLDDVIIPPKKLKGSEEVEYWQGEEMTVEELVERA